MRTRGWSVLWLVAALGCGRPAPAPPTEPTAESAGQPAARDLDIDVREPISLLAKGMLPSVEPWPKVPEVAERGPSLAVLR
ncbi:MAG: hypothetical protein KJO07_13335, partial [Deltaproteobacteria bacterium]|nr:hypothetical protein [Deltaproteobacteria bacterium]